MPEWSWILIAVLIIVAVVAVVVGLSMSRRKKSAQLKERFGPEYDRTVGELGEERAAAELREREKKRKKLNIVDLAPEARREHAEMWAMVQTHFVDAPQDAVGRAELLVTRVMRERGYPVDDFDQRAADISVDHPDVVENYRQAHAIYRAQRDGDISTEDARQAFVHYRALFDRLLGADSGTGPKPGNGDNRRQTHDHA
jgi:hypothetical protein